MEEKSKNTPVSLGHVMAYLAFFIFVFWAGFVLLMMVVVSQQALVKLLWHPLVMTAVLVFDCLWIIVTKFWSKKPVRAKMLGILLVLAFSGSYFACWIYGQLVSGMRY